jgi:ABC-2 type transport system permease protein
MRYINQKNRSILREMITADFKVRYQGSVLGYLWSLLRPLFLFAILYIVFTMIFKVGKGVPFFPVYLLLGIVLWNFFYETTVIGMSSVVANGDLMRKVSIPRYLVVLSSASSAFINLFLNLIVVITFTLISGVKPTFLWLLFPLVIAELFAFALAVAFFLSAFYVKFRDATYIWEVGMQAAFYATPILYPLTLVAEPYRQLFFLNPMAQIIQDARYVLITDQTVTAWSVASPLIIVTCFSLVVFSGIGSYLYFKTQSKWFAENV